MSFFQYLLFPMIIFTMQHSKPSNPTNVFKEASLFIYLTFLLKDDKQKIEWFRYFVFMVLINIIISGILSSRSLPRSIEFWTVSVLAISLDWV